MSVLPFLANAPAPSGSLFGEVVPWLLALLGVVIIGGVGIWVTRRMLRQDSGGGAGGFTLQELRDMKAAGKLSDEEFARARDAIIGRLSEPPAAGDEPEDAAGS